MLINNEDHMIYCRMFTKLLNANERKIINSVNTYIILKYIKHYILIEYLISKFII